MIIQGICKIIQDNKGNDYIAIDISKDVSSQYERFMLSQGFNEEVNLKLTRDHGNYHITVINSMQWGSVKKKGLSEDILNQVNNKEFVFDSFGIGSISKDGNKTFFVVLENPELSKIREIYSLGNQDFHMTLAFKEKDVFGLSKDQSSIVFSNDVIFQNKNKFKP